LTFRVDDGLVRQIVPEGPFRKSKTKIKIMGNAYEIYALRYATMSPRTPSMNFLSPDPHDSTAQDLDYFVWLIRAAVATSWSIPASMPRRRACVRAS